MKTSRPLSLELIQFGGHSAVVDDSVGVMCSALCCSSTPSKRFDRLLR
uniref:EAL domain-containing protein n=1 Tax=Heterorhabditis bacteriophora TaxID=37862 RepID=A0A1I7X523_HETBA